MKIDTQSFIRERFAEFYEKRSSDIEMPVSIERREFGFFLFKERIMVRHKGFTSIEEFRYFLKQTVPSHVYYSAAYYEMPEEKMEEKGWLGADLYFDIDADHIPTKCGKVHDLWVCNGCGFTGKGVPPEKCPVCGNRGFNEKTWPCEVCLDSAKQETMKLLNILTKDFGFPSDGLKVSFSGHRGYHVQVEDEVIRGMNSVSRKEMVDYITGSGFEAGFHGLGEVGYGRSRVLIGPGFDDSGWRGRAARGTYEFLLTATEEDLKKAGLKKKAIDAIIENKDAILRSWKAKGPWGLVKDVGMESWKAIIQEGIENQTVRIDTVVTTDIHRLIRLANTLHGKTGLLKIAFPIDEIEQFDPLKSAVAFKEGMVTVFVEEAPQFRVGDETYGPFKKRKVELPTAAALLLLCKDVAQVVE